MLNKLSDLSSKLRIISDYQTGLLHLRLAMYGLFCLNYPSPCDTGLMAFCDDGAPVTLSLRLYIFAPLVT